MLSNSLKPEGGAAGIREYAKLRIFTIMLSAGLCVATAGTL